MKYRKVRGTQDIYAPEIFLWQQVESAAIELLRAYGFAEIRTPLFEESGLFNRSIGEDTDIVEKEMYSFKDKKGRDLTLRPEGTASVIRAGIEQNLFTQGSVNKLYYLGPMFRYERPQAGRYRQFYQIGGEVVGSASPWRDVEIISWCLDFFTNIGLAGLKVFINNVGCAECRPAYRQVLKNYLQEKSGDLCADCLRRLERNPLRILDCKVEKCKSIVADIPAMEEHLCPACRDNFTAVKQGLEVLAIPFVVDKHLVRGLDYYTRAVFEIKSEKLGAQDTVAAGGRYDNLVKELGGPDMPAVGFALGVERTVEVLKKQEISGQDISLIDIYCALLGENVVAKVLPLVRSLRQKGYKVEVGLEGRSLKSQMRLADQYKANYAIIIGENELQQNKAVLRNMRTKEQQEVGFNKVAEVIEKKTL